ncbi:hypothetical protein MSAN_01361400 [Mycena sanguinolenta]|uniref:Uncharacterized protein n=1 Tax=Mycena sanguinolenta TaxID=230812 RepID=A0A8H6YAW8_9AGAR|nr:hypothetical protein MSAN_01361400 [Mycena sanguinolenta]
MGFAQFRSLWTWPSTPLPPILLVTARHYTRLVLLDNSRSIIVLEILSFTLSDERQRRRGFESGTRTSTPLDAATGPPQLAR